MGIGLLFLGLVLALAGGDPRGRGPLTPALLIFGAALTVAELLAFRSARARQRLSVRRDFRAVAAKRARVSGGEHASTDYFVTLESCSGARKEYSASDDLYGQLAEGDLGVADLRGGEIVRFRRFELDA